MLSYHVVLFFGKEMQLGRHMEVLVLLVAMGMSVVSSDMWLWVPSFGLVPQLHHCQMLVRGFRSILPIPSFSKMPPVLF